MIKKVFSSILILVILISISWAFNPEEKLNNDEYESRARIISKNIRCLVCQNQTIDDSNAELAQDIRKLIRNQITEGKTDREVQEFLVSRYGDFILMNPPMKLETALLWLAPLILISIGILIVFFSFRNNSKKLLK